MRKKPELRRVNPELPPNSKLMTLEEIKEQYGGMSDVDLYVEANKQQQMEDIERSLNAMEGSVNYVNGYIFFVDKESGSAVQVNPSGERKILPPIPHLPEHFLDDLMSTGRVVLYTEIKDGKPIVTIVDPNKDLPLTDK